MALKVNNSIQYKFMNIGVLCVILTRASVCQSVCLPVSLSLSISVCVSLSLSLSLSLSVCVCVCVCLSLCLLYYFVYSWGKLCRPYVGVFLFFFFPPFHLPCLSSQNATARLIGFLKCKNNIDVFLYNIVQPSLLLPYDVPYLNAIFNATYHVLLIFFCKK